MYGPTADLHTVEIEHAKSSVQENHFRWLDGIGEPEGSGEKWLSIGTSGSDTLLRFSGEADFLVRPNHRKIEISASPELEPSGLQHLLLNQVIPRYLCSEGYLVLHASAVSMNGAGVLFVGPSGSGKSSLAALLCQAGASLIADDATPIHQLASGDLRILASEAPLRLNPDSAEALGGSNSSAGEFTRGKHALPSPTAKRSPSVSLSAAYCLNPSGDNSGGSVQIERLSPVEFFQRAVSQVFRLDPSKTATIAQEFEQLSGLAEAVPVHLLSYPHDWSQLESLATSLTQHHSRLVQTFKSSRRASEDAV